MLFYKFTDVNVKSETIVVTGYQLPVPGNRNPETGNKMLYEGKMYYNLFPACGKTTDGLKLFAFSKSMVA